MTQRHENTRPKYSKRKQHLYCETKEAKSEPTRLSENASSVQSPPGKTQNVSPTAEHFRLD